MGFGRRKERTTVSQVYDRWQNKHKKKEHSKSETNKRETTKKKTKKKKTDAQNTSSVGTTSGGGKKESQECGQRFHRHSTYSRQCAGQEGGSGQREKRQTYLDEEVERPKHGKGGKEDSANKKARMDAEPDKKKKKKKNAETKNGNGPKKILLLGEGLNLKEKLTSRGKMSRTKAKNEWCPVSNERGQ